MTKCLTFLSKRSAILALNIALFSCHAGISYAAGLQFTSLGCEKGDDMHLVTKLAASNDIEALKATEAHLIASGRCLTLQKGTDVRLITSVRAYAPGANLLYSLAKVELLNRQVYILRQNLGQ